MIAVQGGGTGREGGGEGGTDNVAEGARYENNRRLERDDQVC